MESNVEDPVVVDNAGMTEVERRLSIQLFCVLALTCRGKALEPRLALIAPTRVDDPVQTMGEQAEGL